MALNKITIYKIFRWWVFKQVKLLGEYINYPDVLSFLLDISEDGFNILCYLYCHENLILFQIFVIPDLAVNLLNLELLNLYQITAFEYFC